MSDQQRKYKQFTTLHQRDDAFVIANAWDAGSARLLSSLGFPALATTSAGYAFSAGKRDSAASLSRREILDNARQIVEATDLPVSADLEDGFGTSAAQCAETVSQAIDTGLVGGSIEDATGYDDNPIHDFELAVERVSAAAEAARNRPFLLTARAENYLWGRPDLDDTIARLRAYSAAGADVLYAPGLPDLDSIKALCAALDKPVNVVMGLGNRHWTVEQLAGVGVRRISVGGSFARVAWAALKRAAEEVRDSGSFTYSQEAIPDAEMRSLMMPERPSERRV